ncbi:hypothetical protein [Ciceribacter thiooxidans]|uniref:DUF2922 domain-containing protein n=1 Tax=Ciceribacter thiooxidans TaxID=1969821 RepID=A0ABV7I810_9HYPH|nr:hypothetical protein [Ciceribacter thiooxidans]
MKQSNQRKLHSLLFEEGRELVNIKFMPGNDRGLTPAKLSDAAARAIGDALDSGLVSQPPRTGMNKCRLDAFA